METPPQTLTTRRFLVVAGLVSRHPSLQAVTILGASLFPMLLSHAGSPLFAAAAAEIFAIASPLLGLRHRHFWRYEAVSFLAHWALLFSYFTICDKLTGGLGDDAMIFLLPFSTPLASYPLAILIHLVLRAQRSTARA